ncbi:MAG: DUF1294 domain-containing protein [Sandaracinaceae bacterium]
MWFGAVMLLAAYNLLVAGVFAFDKHRAKSAGRRVSERMLWRLTALGGAAGAWFGMRVFRHKTKKPRFVWGVPLLLLLQLGGVAAAGFLVGRGPVDMAQWRDAGCARSSLPFSSLDVGPVRGRVRR